LGYGCRVRLDRIHDAHMVGRMSHEGVTVNWDYGRWGLDEVIVFYVVGIIFDRIGGTWMISGGKFLCSDFVCSEKATSRTTRTSHCVFMARLMKIWLKGI
jgi:hypothetical protein